MVRNPGVGRLAEGGAVLTAAGEAESTRRVQGSGNWQTRAHGEGVSVHLGRGLGAQCTGKEALEQACALRSPRGRRVQPSRARVCKEVCMELERVRLCALGGVRDARRRV